MENHLEQFNLKNTIAVVTGGASGLGMTMGEALASAGSSIAILDINLEKAEETAQKFATEYGVQAKAWQLDVTDRERVPLVIDEIIHTFGRIDILLNNSGIWRNAPAEDMLWQDWYDVINVCLNGTFLMSQAVAKKSMIPNGGGKIINIGSVSGMFINDAPYKCSYNAAKAGVITLTQALAAEWARYNIRVNCISPCTAKYENAKDNPNPKRQKAWATIPMGRHAYSKELCGALIYLASNASSFVTGVNLPIDGGDTLWKGTEPIGIIGGPEGNK